MSADSDARYFGWLKSCVTSAADEPEAYRNLARYFHELADGDEGTSAHKVSDALFEMEEAWQQRRNQADSGICPDCHRKDSHDFRCPCRNVIKEAKAE